MTSKLASTARAIARQPNFSGLLGATVCLGMAFSFFAPYISPWGTAEGGRSPSSFSGFMTCTSLCAIVCGTLLGRLSDTRVSRKTILVIAATGGALGYLGYGFFRNPLVLGFVGCTFLALSSGCFSQLFAHVREEYKNPVGGGLEPSMLMSLVRVCFSFAWTVGPALGAVILVATGFRGLYAAAAGLWLAFLAGVLFFVPNRPRHESVRVATGDSVWKTFRRGDVILCTAAFAFITASQSINMMNLPLAIIHTLHGTERDFGIVFGIGPLVEVPLMLWFGHLSSIGYQIRLIRLGFILSILYFACLCLATEPWHVYVLQLLSGTIISITSTVALVFYQDLLPGQAGLATALYTNAQACGNLLGVLSFGFLVEGVGNRGVFGVCALLSVLALGFILAYRRDPQRAL